MTHAERDRLPLRGENSTHSGQDRAPCEGKLGTCRTEPGPLRGKSGTRWTEPAPLRGKTLHIPDRTGPPLRGGNGACLSSHKDMAGCATAGAARPAAAFYLSRRFPAGAHGVRTKPYPHGKNAAHAGQRPPSLTAGKLGTRRTGPGLLRGENLGTHRTEIASPYEGETALACLVTRIWLAAAQPGLCAPPRLF